jgi:menaquinone-dependent protoporphyrinogen oxidase
MPTKILVAFATSEGQTARVASGIGERLAALGHEVVEVDLEKSVPDPAGFDGVVVGGSVHAGHFQHELRCYVAAYAPRLNQMPSWFFGVSLSEGIGKGAFTHENAVKQIETFLGEFSWRPSEAFSVGGALMYREYSWPKRMLMKQIVSKNGGQTDTSRDWEFTDWDAVKAFAGRVSAGVLNNPKPELSRS